MRTMTRSVGMAFALVIGLAGPGQAAGPGTTAGDGPVAGAPVFEPIDVRGLDPVVRPFVVDPGRRVTVLLRLAGAPVAAVEAAATAEGRAFEPWQRTAVRATLRGRQDVLRAGLAALGARVLGQYQDAYDGMKVRVALRDVDRLRRLPGVADVVAVPRYAPVTARSDRYIGAGDAWSVGTGITGRGVKIAIIDSGIDYYHADLGGSGNPADFANDDGLTIGTAAFPNAKVAGGFDFVGDDYDPSNGVDPAPDPDPLDCNGHGTEVAGAAAGYGVTARGATYRGRYDAAALAKQDFAIGPGVAPGARLYALRVFGCEGGTDVILDAIDWAVKNRMDVINLSLGTTFGGPDSPDVVAVDNAARAGIVVVAAAGNEGPVAYTASSPATATRAIAVAAVDAVASLPAATIDLGGITAVDLDGASPFSVTGPLAVLRDASGAIGLGCAAADYEGVAPGAIVVARRGTCPIADRASLGQAAGAAAVVLVDNAGGGAYPPAVGSIPDVTIPLLGVTRADAWHFETANGVVVSIASRGQVANPAYTRAADFSSGGPRDGDAALKPDVAAPGVALATAEMGAGTAGAIASGTSLATPLVTGVAALVRQAHPRWTVEQVKSAITTTASAARIAGYDPRVDGSGLVEARRAVDTVVLAATAPGSASLSFGVRDLAGASTLARTLTLTNTGSVPVRYTFAASVVGRPLGARVSVSPSTVTVAAHGSAAASVTIRLSAAAVSRLPDAESPADAAALLTSIRGSVVATPATASRGVYPLRIPFLLVPLARSNVVAPATVSLTRDDASGRAVGTATLRNTGAHRGVADVFSWGIRSGDAGLGSMDVRAVGVQALGTGLDGTALPDDDRLLVFAINTYRPWGSPATNEFDISVFVGDAYFVIGVLDHGLVAEGVPDGRLGCFVGTLQGEDLAFDVQAAVFAKAGANGTTVRCGVLASTLGIHGPGQPLEYSVDATSLVQPLADRVAGSALFDPFAPSVSQGDRLSIAPGKQATLHLWADPARLEATPAVGWMIVSPDDPAGAAQADTIPLVVPAPAP